MAKAKGTIRASQVPVAPSRVAGFLDFGSMNRFPQDLIKAVGGSLTAGSCVKRRAQFITGNGFYRRDLSEMVVNRQGQTLDGILRRTGWNVGFFECPALHIQYNGLGKVAGIRPCPVETVRLGMPDAYDNINHAGIFPFLDSTVFKQKGNAKTRMTMFNPNVDVVRKEIEVAGGIDKYNGQILYLPMLSTGDYYYHVPDWFKAITCIETEKELNIFDHKQTVNGFAIGGIYSYYDEEPTVRRNDADDESKPGYHAGANQVGEIDKDSLEYQFAASMGNREAGNVIFLKHTSKETFQNARFDNVTGAQMSERNGSLNQRTPENICRAFEVPPSLIGLNRQNGLASTADQLRTDVNFMYQSVNDYQRVVKQSFEAVLNNWCVPLGEVDMSIEALDFFNEKKKNVPLAG